MRRKMFMKEDIKKEASIFDSRIAKHCIRNHSIVILHAEQKRWLLHVVRYTFQWLWLAGLLNQLQLHGIWILKKCGKHKKFSMTSLFCRCDYMPQQLGVHSVNVFFAGNPIPNSPFGVKVSNLISYENKLPVVTPYFLRQHRIRVTTFVRMLLYNN
jgi:hypothetical protein